MVIATLLAKLEQSNRAENMSPRFKMLEQESFRNLRQKVRTWLWSEQQVSGGRPRQQL
jgi:hypothetical protein